MCPFSITGPLLAHWSGQAKKSIHKDQSQCWRITASSVNSMGNNSTNCCLFTAGNTGNVTDPVLPVIVVFPSMYCISPCFGSWFSNRTGGKRNDIFKATWFGYGTYSSVMSVTVTLSLISPPSDRHFITINHITNIFCAKPWCLDVMKKGESDVLAWPFWLKFALLSTCKCTTTHRIEEALCRKSKNMERTRRHTLYASRDVAEHSVWEQDSTPTRYALICLAEKDLRGFFLA